ncbi:MAG: 50S ribosomal protein L11 methyltransferase, partial [Staphylococcus lugdunensis]|nr:50S ribosomal protein L11 methyltransferase [Staphylococcus lugdunensis]
ITSGIITEKHLEIEAHMKQVGFDIISIEQNNGWVCLVGQKVSE